MPNAVYVVDVNSVEVFKFRLDNFWKLQDVKIHYCRVPTLLVLENDLSLILKLLRVSTNVFRTIGTGSEKLQIEPSCVCQHH